MLRLSKITDYGTKIMLAMTMPADCWHTANGLAAATNVSLPTVSKILKILTKGSLLVSQRGSQGGYQLARSAKLITLAEVIKVMEGGIAMTECQQLVSYCQIEAQCSVKDNWSLISQAIADILRNISLAQMSKPMHTKEFSLAFHQ